MINGQLVTGPVRFEGERDGVSMYMSGVDLLNVKNDKIVRVDLFSEDAGRRMPPGALITCSAHPKPTCDSGVCHKWAGWPANFCGSSRYQPFPDYFFVMGVPLIPSTSQMP